MAGALGSIWHLIYGAGTSPPLGTLGIGLARRYYLRLFCRRFCYGRYWDWAYSDGTRGLGGAFGILGRRLFTLSTLAS